MKRTFTKEEKSIIERNREMIKIQSSGGGTPPISVLMKEASHMFIVLAKEISDGQGNIKFSRRGILMHLMHNDGIPQQKLSEFCRLSAPTISAELAEMERGGLVIRKKSENDARTTLVYITDKGRDANNAMRESFHRAEEIMLSGMEEKEYAEFSRMLEKMRMNMLQFIDNYGESQKHGNAGTEDTI